MIDIDNILETTKEKYPWIHHDNLFPGIKSYELGPLNDERSITTYLGHFQSFSHLTTYFDLYIDKRKTHPNYLDVLLDMDFEREDKREWSKLETFSEFYTYETNKYKKQIKDTKIEKFIQELNKKTMQINEIVPKIKTKRDNLDNLIQPVFEWMSIILLAYPEQEQKEMSERIVGMMYNYKPGKGVLLYEKNIIFHNKQEVEKYLKEKKQ